MKRIFHFLSAAVKTFVQCYREAARLARENGENPAKYGFHEFRETEMGPLFFYTETCPEGTYLVGVIEMDDDKKEGLRRNSEREHKTADNLIIPGDEYSPDQKTVKQEF